MFKFDRPTLVTLTAPTCSGKSFLLNHLVDDLGAFTRIVSTTTRAKRHGEVDGVDYHFIDTETSLQLEREGKFAELIEFRGARYGVTAEEMANKMTGDVAPIIILEPKGVEIYQQLCREHGWDMFKIFVYTPEPLRISRLNKRLAYDIKKLIATGATGVEKIIETHSDRLLSITGDERLWQCRNTWDLLVPGYERDKAINNIKQGIKWRNYRNAQLNT